ncbi:hypothetical protein ACFYQT_39790 [Streptomyces tibetensis]|uniref:Uncharacterized protein n=1 Tax=Streptomyces tibetensis TaxID=2382123 RepID=A0ABW6N9T3_9ACTN
MRQPTLRHPEHWHALEETDEHAWLDDWARLHLIPVTHHPEPAAAPALVPSLAGRH